MLVLFAAIGGTLLGVGFGFVAVLALLEHYKVRTWLAIGLAAILSLPIGIVLGAATAAGLIFVVYPDFNWTF